MFRGQLALHPELRCWAIVFCSLNGVLKCSLALRICTRNVGYINHRVALGLELF